MLKTDDEFEKLNEIIYDIHMSKSVTEYTDRVDKFHNYYKNKKIYNQFMII